MTVIAGVLDALISLKATPRILVLGDLMMDETLSGHALRLSPEAPVPVLDSLDRSVVPGGAANLAVNLKTLGVDVTLAGVVGQDGAATELREALDKLKLTHILISDQSRPTTLKQRMVASGQQLLRVDREVRDPLSSEVEDKLWSSIEPGLSSFSAIILSDYSKGVLLGELSRRIIEAAQKASIPVVVDPKGQDYQRYHGVTALTPNRDELEKALGHKITGRSEEDAAALQILEVTGAQNLVLTLGGDGVRIYSKEGEPLHIHAEARRVYDVQGAGDTFVAAYALGIAIKRPPVESARFANRAAAVVVGKRGTATVSLEEMMAIRTPVGRSMDTKVLGLIELQRALDTERQQGRRIVFTNGCFDILHRGHVRYLERARELGDILVVGLNSDTSVRKLKGEGRPVMDEEGRAEVLAALASVSYVHIFSDERPDALVEAVHPDILAKGADYKVSDIAGASFVLSYGGRVELVDLVDGESTTKLMAKIQANQS